MCANRALASSAAFCASRGRRKQLGTAQGGGARAEQRAESLGGHRGHTGQPGYEARADPPFRKRGEGFHLGPKQRQQRSGACLRVRGTRNIMDASRREPKQWRGHAISGISILQHRFVIGQLLST
jgi:hypothetical protein